MSLGNRNNQHDFAKVQNANIPRSKFDRSHTVKDTMYFDELTPIMVEEILPGDTINLNLKFFGRLATQIVPILDNLYLKYFFFFVPNRLVWNNWEKFQGFQENPGDSTDFTIPQMQLPTNGPQLGSTGDKFGLPVGNYTGAAETVNALPFRGDLLIYNQWFRDQNLQNSYPVPKDNGPDSYGSFATLRKINRKHDYFTSMLPWPQKGPSIAMPLGTSAPVVGEAGVALQMRGNTANAVSSLINTSGIGANFSTAYANGETIGLKLTAPTGLIADLSAATAATINQLRQGFMLQSIFELDARGGTRYVEALRARFGVVSPDYRLQIPEYLGGGMARINTHPVANTTPGDTDQPQASLAAFSTVSDQSRVGFTKSFDEHGYVIGYAVATADITYQQGTERMWSRKTRFEFFEPKLQELGEQAVYNREWYQQNAAATSPTTGNGAVAGYQERFGEYRFKQSQIRGQFRSTVPQPLDMWHMAEKFNAPPALNGIYIQNSTPIERAIAIDTEPDLLMDYWFQMSHARPMVSYPQPAILGRF